MKKSVAILSSVLLLMITSCRDIEVDLLTAIPLEKKVQNASIQKSDSISFSSTADDGEKDPPRKDLGEWKQEPKENKIP